MPQYQAQGMLPKKHFTKLYRHDKDATDGSFYFEYIITAEGFAAEASLQYRLRAAARVTRTEVLPEVNPKLREDMADAYNLMFEVERIKSGGDFVQSRREMLCSTETAFSVAKPDKPMTGFYRNSMADEVVLIVQGSGTLESSFGNIPYGELDVVYVPRGDTVRWKSDAKPHLMVIFESIAPISVPQEFLKPNGQFREHAPYKERDIRMPVLQPAIDETGEFPIDVKLDKKRIRTWIDHHPFDVVGWDGYYYPWALNLKDYEPLSGRIALLPDRYSLFTTPRTLITLISPRRLADHPDAMPMQPHHQNLEFDEILYRFSGSTGDTEPQPGSFTLHPRGLDHGPKPGFEKLPIRTYQEAWGFMIDTRDRLIPTEAAMQAMDDSYGKMYVTDQAKVRAIRGGVMETALRGTAKAVRSPKHAQQRQGREPAPVGPEAIKPAMLAAHEPARERRGAYLQSLQRGVAVLDALAQSPRAQTAKQVALTLDLDRTITHRILRTLQREGLVDAVAGGYQLGGHTLLLGNAYLDHLNIRRLAMPYLLDLRYKGFSGRDWSMSLLVPVGRVVTIVDQMLPPNGPLDMVLGIGTRFPIDHTAAGRCMLAFTPQDRVAALIGQDRATELASRFEDIRAAGGVDFAREDEPHGRPGLVAMAALIRDRANQPVAGLSISGLGLTPYAARDSEVALQLRRTAAQIGAALR